VILPCIMAVNFAKHTAFSRITLPEGVSLYPNGNVRFRKIDNSGGESYEQWQKWLTSAKIIVQKLRCARRRLDRECGLQVAPRDKHGFRSLASVRQRKANRLAKLRNKHESAAKAASAAAERGRAGVRRTVVFETVRQNEGHTQTFSARPLFLELPHRELEDIISDESEYEHQEEPPTEERPLLLEDIMSSESEGEREELPTRPQLIENIISSESEGEREELPSRPLLIENIISSQYEGERRQELLEDISSESESDRTEESERASPSQFMTLPSIGQVNDRMSSEHDDIECHEHLLQQVINCDDGIVFDDRVCAGSGSPAPGARSPAQNITRNAISPRENDDDTEENWDDDPDFVPWTHGGVRAALETAVDTVWDVGYEKKEEFVRNVFINTFKYSGKSTDVKQIFQFADENRNRETCHAIEEFMANFPEDFSFIAGDDDPLQEGTQNVRLITTPDIKEKIAVDYVMTEDPQTCSQYVKELLKDTELGFDAEFYHTFNDRGVRVLQFYSERLRKTYIFWMPKWRGDQLLHAGHVKELLESEKIKKYTVGKGDAEILESRHGIKCKNFIDVQVLCSAVIKDIIPSIVFRMKVGQNVMAVSSGVRPPMYSSIAELERNEKKYGYIWDFLWEDCQNHEQRLLNRKKLLYCAYDPFATLKIAQHLTSLEPSSSSLQSIRIPITQRKSKKWTVTHRSTWHAC
jgi:3'-5' exonuclease